MTQSLYILRWAAFLLWNDGRREQGGKGPGERWEGAEERRRLWGDAGLFGPRGVRQGHGITLSLAAEKTRSLDTRVPELGWEL